MHLSFYTYHKDWSSQTVSQPQIFLCSHCHDEINSSFALLQKVRRTHHFGAPPRSVPGKAQPRASWSKGRLFCRAREIRHVWWRAHCERWSDFGALLELCRLQLPCSDFQLHPPHRLRGKGKITSKSFCLLPLLRREEQKCILWGPLQDMNVNHTALSFFQCFHSHMYIETFLSPFFPLD